MIPVTFLHEAKLDLLDSIEYYDKKSFGLGLDFEKEIKISVGQIKKHPKLWMKREDDTRRCLLRRFPFSIVYMYFENHIWIVAIAHHKRKPNYWKHRMNDKSV